MRCSISRRKPLRRRSRERIGRKRSSGIRTSSRVPEGTLTRRTCDSGSSSRRTRCYLTGTSGACTIARDGPPESRPSAPRRTPTVPRAAGASIRWGRIASGSLGLRELTQMRGLGVLSAASEAVSAATAGWAPIGMEIRSGARRRLKKSSLRRIRWGFIRPGSRWGGAASTEHGRWRSPRTSWTRLPKEQRNRASSGRLVRARQSLEPPHLRRRQRDLPRTERTAKDRLQQTESPANIPVPPGRNRGQRRRNRPSES